MSGVLLVLSAVCFATAGVLGIGRGLCDQTTCGAASWALVSLVVAGIALFLFGFLSVLAHRGEKG